MQMDRLETVRRWLGYQKKRLVSEIFETEANRRARSRLRERRIDSALSVAPSAAPDNDRSPAA
jgi:hypothetical protein